MSLCSCKQKGLELSGRAPQPFLWSFQKKKKCSCDWVDCSGRTLQGPRHEFRLDMQFSVHQGKGGLPAQRTTSVPTDEGCGREGRLGTYLKAETIYAAR